MIYAKPVAPWGNWVPARPHKLNTVNRDAMNVCYLSGCGCVLTGE